MLKFQEGDWVKQRNGTVVGPISVNHRGLLTVPQMSGLEYHYPSGHFAFNTDHDFDFVCVVPEPKPLPAPIERVTVFGGGVWCTTHGVEVCDKSLKSLYGSLSQDYRLFRTVTTFIEEL